MPTGSVQIEQFIDNPAIFFFFFCMRHCFFFFYNLYVNICYSRAVKSSDTWTFDTQNRRYDDRSFNIGKFSSQKFLPKSLGRNS